MLSFFDAMIQYLGYIFFGILIFLGLMRFIKIVFVRDKGAAKQKTPAPSSEIEVKDSKVIAAITAAITCYYQSQATNTNTATPPSGFVVRSVKKRI